MDDVTGSQPAAGVAGLPPLTPNMPAAGQSTLPPQMPTGQMPAVVAQPTRPMPVQRTQPVAMPPIQPVRPMAPMQQPVQPQPLPVQPLAQQAPVQPQMPPVMPQVMQPQPMRPVNPVAAAPAPNVVPPWQHVDNGMPQMQQPLAMPPMQPMQQPIQQPFMQAPAVRPMAPLPQPVMPMQPMQPMQQPVAAAPLTQAAPVGLDMFQKTPPPPIDVQVDQPSFQAMLSSEEQKDLFGHEKLSTTQKIVIVVIAIVALGAILGAGLWVYSTVFGGGANTAVDTDADGLSDAEERSLGTDLKNPDTDGDGFTDGEEVQHGYSPLKK